MKTIIVMMVLSIVYLVAMDMINKKINTIDFTSNSPIQYETTTSSYYEVKISGEVENPGTYTVTRGAKLSYLITLAGGVKDSADPNSYNLDTILSDRGSYYIAKVLGDGNEKISINNASIAQLDTLPGIGSVLANRIVSYRASNGKFASIEDIMKVSGIGDTLFEQIKDLICL